MYKVYFIFQGLERTSQGLEYKKVMVIKKISA